MQGDVVGSNEEKIKEKATFVNIDLVSWLPANVSGKIWKVNDSIKSLFLYKIKYLANNNTCKYVKPSRSLS